MRYFLCNSVPVFQACFAYGKRKTADQRRSISQKVDAIWLSRFVKAESGAISVEAVLWLPIYLVFISLIVDVSNMMHSRSIAMRILQDANRHAVTGYLVEEEEVLSQIAARMQTISGTPEVEVAWNADDIISVVRYPARDVQIIGLISIFTNMELSVHSYNRFEI